MVCIRKWIGNQIPDSEFKKKLKIVYNFVNETISWGYRLVRKEEKENNIVIHFKKKPLKGYSIIFPPNNNVPQKFLSYELYGYLKRGLPSEGSTIIHAGAYPSELEVILSKIMGDKLRYCPLEPIPSNKEYSDLVLKANNVGEYVKIIPLALLNKKGLQKFKQQGVTSYIIEDGKDETGINVETTTIDDFVISNQIDLNKPLWIFLDTEGEEINILDGAKKTMESKKFRFIIASYHKIGGVQSYRILHQKYGNTFSVKTVFPHHLTTFIENKYSGN